MAPETFCWSYMGNFEPDQPGAFDQLPVEYPPDPPDEEPDQLVCNTTLDKDDCELAGGTYFSQNKYCDCP